MKKYLFALAASLTIFGLTSCEPFDGNNIIITETRPVANFDAISLPINAELILRQGPETSLKIEGESNVLSILRSQVSNRRLRFSFDENWVRSNQRIKIWVTTPLLSEISMSGSGSIFGDNTFITENLRISHSGSGNIDFGAEVRNNVELDLTGSGNVFLEGTARSFNVNQTGSGEVQAFNLDVDRADIDMIGSGVCETRVFKTLTARISGSGDIYFKGKPATVNSKITGSGKLLVAD